MPCLSSHTRWGPSRAARPRTKRKGNGDRDDEDDGDDDEDDDDRHDEGEYEDEDRKNGGPPWRDRTGGGRGRRGMEGEESPREMGLIGRCLSVARARARTERRIQAYIVSCKSSSRIEG